MDYDERQLKEIALAIFYMVNFAHGTVGHNHLMLIAKMAYELDFHLGVGPNKLPALMRDGTVVLELKDAKS